MHNSIGAPSLQERDLIAEQREVRLERMVGELLKTNQELRFQMALLKQRPETGNGAEGDQLSWAGLAWPG